MLLATRAKSVPGTGLVLARPACRCAVPVSHTAAATPPLYAAPLPCPACPFPLPPVQVMRAYSRISDSFERYMSQHQGPLPGNLQAVMAHAQQQMQLQVQQVQQEQQRTTGNGNSEAAVP